MPTHPEPPVTSPLSGLTPAEAEFRLRTIGPNRLVTPNRFGWVTDMLSLLADPMALMLGSAAIVYFFLGNTRDGIILLVALIPVLGIDVLLHARSRQALKTLAQAIAPKAHVIRGGTEVDIPSEGLVPGDVVVLREGDVVHADGILRQTANLAVDESALTGESEPQEKQPYNGPATHPLAQANQFFAGSTVAVGHGYGEILATGAQTHYGHLAHLVAHTDTAPTPLQRQISTMIRAFSAVAAVVVVAAFVLVLRQGTPLPQALLAAISLAMAAIPEEFPLVFTLFLSLAAWRLSQRGVLIRRLASVETLGSTTVICTDKTGTLTSGQFILDKPVPWPITTSVETLLETAVLACEPHPTDMMERSIVASAQKHGLEPNTLLTQWRLIADYPFDPLGKHMSHVWEQAQPDGQYLRRVVAKGALEGILDHCVLSLQERTAINTMHQNLAGQGLRVLVVAERAFVHEANADRGTSPTTTTGNHPADLAADERTNAEQRLTVCGFLGFRDPLRPEVPAAIAECQAAGIAVKVITGDHILTAHAIADMAGIIHTPDGLLTGAELDALPADHVATRVSQASIFARIRPEQKYTIVDALKRSGDIVAMTGDGINDAPALRRADIGVSMGTHATEVARSSADIVLLDDNFASLTATIREGRHILGNIQHAFLYLLAFHVPILGLALAVPFLGLPLLLLPMHLVWLQLIVHPVSALIFEDHPAPPDLMRRPPRDPRAALLPWHQVLPSLLSGISLTMAVLFMYWTHLGGTLSYARSGAMAVLILGGLLLIVAEQAGDRPWLHISVPRTARFWIVFGLVTLSLPVSMLVPELAQTLQMEPLTLRDWGEATGLAIASVAWRAGGTTWLTTLSR